MRSHPLYVRMKRWVVGDGIDTIYIVSQKQRNYDESDVYRSRVCCKA